MNAERSGKRRFALGMVDKVLLGILALLAVVIIALGILQRAGLSLINGTLMLQLPVLAVTVLVCWGGYALVRRIRNRTVKIVVGSVAVLLLCLALVLVSSYISFIGAITVPQRYATLKSPSGARQVVVLRTLDGDDERLEARRTARLTADPDGDPEFVIQDWGYMYKAWPKAWGPFYRSKADVQGEVYLTFDGATETSGEEGEAVQLPRGTLMVEWLDDEAAARFYVQEPGPGEGGECTVTF